MKKLILAVLAVMIISETAFAMLFAVPIDRKEAVKIAGEFIGGEIYDMGEDGEESIPEGAAPIDIDATKRNNLF